LKKHKTLLCFVEWHYVLQYYYLLHPNVFLRTQPLHFRHILMTMSIKQAATANRFDGCRSGASHNQVKTSSCMVLLLLVSAWVTDACPKPRLVTQSQGSLTPPGGHFTPNDSLDIKWFTLCALWPLGPVLLTYCQILFLLSCQCTQAM